MKVEVFVDGKPQGRPIQMAPGDELLFEAGEQLDLVVRGKVAIRDRKIERMGDKIGEQYRRILELERQIAELRAQA